MERTQAVESKNAKTKLNVEKILPDNHNKPYDMHEVIDGIVDKDSFFEMKKLFAGELITGFARLHGLPILGCLCIRCRCYDHGHTVRLGVAGSSRLPCALHTMIPCCV